MKKPINATLSLVTVAISFATSSYASAGAENSPATIYAPQALTLSDLAYNPFDVDAIEKTEQSTIAQMFSTKCCASGTCDSNSIYEIYQELGSLSEETLTPA